MKKILVGVLSITVFISTVAAQETRKPKVKTELHDQKEMSAKQLNLSADQQQQLKANREASKKQLQELDKLETLSVKEYKTRKAAIHKEQKEKMDAILTEEQKSQLAKNRLEKKAGHDKKGGGKMEKMTSSLNLSDDQVVTIKANRKALQEQAKAIKEDQKLSESEKRQKLTALKEQYKNENKKIMTADQLEKMKEMKKERPAKD